MVVVSQSGWSRMNGSSSWHRRRYTLPQADKNFESFGGIGSPIPHYRQRVLSDPITNHRKSAMRNNNRHPQPSNPRSRGMRVSASTLGHAGFEEDPGLAVDNPQTILGACLRPLVAGIQYFTNRRREERLRYAAEQTLIHENFRRAMAESKPQEHEPGCERPGELQREGRLQTGG